MIVHRIIIDKEAFKKYEDFINTTIADGGCFSSAYYKTEVYKMWENADLVARNHPSFKVNPCGCCTNLHSTLPQKQLDGSGLIEFWLDPVSSWK